MGRIEEVHGPSPLFENAWISGFGKTKVEDESGAGAEQVDVQWVNVRRWSEYTLYRITLDYYQVRSE